MMLWRGMESDGVGGCKAKRVFGIQDTGIAFPGPTLKDREPVIKVYSDRRDVVALKVARSSILEECTYTSGILRRIDC